MSAPDEVDPLAHMSWCKGIGQHNGYGECEVDALVGDDGDRGSITLTGVPCDNTYVAVAVTCYEPEDVDQLVVDLAAWRAQLAEARAEINCDNHPERHVDDDQDDGDDEDDDPLLCDGCGTDTTSLLGVDDQWLCRTCCAGRGIAFDPR